MHYASARGLHRQFWLRVRRWKRELYGMVRFELSKHLRWHVEIGCNSYNFRAGRLAFTPKFRATFTFYGAGQLTRDAVTTLNVHVSVHDDRRHPVGNYWVTDMRSLMDHGQSLIQQFRYIGGRYDHALPYQPPCPGLPANNTTAAYLLDCDRSSGTWRLGKCVTNNPEVA